MILTRRLCKAILLMLCLSLISCSAASKNFIPPTRPHSSSYPTVIIDAGHGGEDGGAVGANGVYEKDLNLDISLELYALLRSAGIPARLTRSTDTLLYDRNADYEGRKKLLDMAARVNIAEEYGQAVFISVHMNYFTQSKYSGLQVYYSERSASSFALAQCIQSSVRRNLQPNNSRSTKPSAGGIYLLERINHPAVLIECGFLSNPEECDLLCSRSYQKRLALIIFSSIADHLKNTSK